MRESPFAPSQNRWVCLPQVPRDGQTKVQIWVGKADEGIFRRGRAQCPAPQSCHTLHSSMVFSQHQEGLVQVTNRLAGAATYLRWERER